MRKFLIVAIASIFATCSLYAGNAYVSSQDETSAVVFASDDNPLAPDASVETVANALDWDKLDKLVSEDTEMTASNKTSYELIKDLVEPVAKEKALRKAPYYKYIRENLYPKALKS